MHPPCTTPGCTNIALRPKGKYCEACRKVRCAESRRKFLEERGEDRKKPRPELPDKDMVRIGSVGMHRLMMKVCT